MNPLLSLVRGVQANPFMQAVNAAMRGESPEEFMKKLAQNDLRLQGLDLNNLENTANQLCELRGVDPEALKQQVKNNINNLL